MYKFKGVNAQIQKVEVLFNARNQVIFQEVIHESNKQDNEFQVIIDSKKYRLEKEDYENLIKVIMVDKE